MEGANTQNNRSRTTIVANLSGIVGDTVTSFKVARPASESVKIGLVDFYSEYRITSRCSTMLKLRFTCDVVICCWKKSQRRL